MNQRLFLLRHAPGRELTHVRRAATHARKQGHELVNHSDCYRHAGLWR